MNNTPIKALGSSQTQPRVHSWWPKQGLLISKEFDPKQGLLISKEFDPKQSLLISKELISQTVISKKNIYY